MAAHDRAPLRVAVLAQSGPRREAVGRLLERQFRVVASAAPDDVRGLGDLGAQGVDLLLVDLDEGTAREPDILLELIERSPVPVLFNDASASASQADLGARLARKFRALSGVRPPRLRRPGRSGAPPDTVPPDTIPGTDSGVLPGVGRGAVRDSPPDLGSEPAVVGAPVAAAPVPEAPRTETPHEGSSEWSDPAPAPEWIDRSPPDGGCPVPGDVDSGVAGSDAPEPYTPGRSATVTDRARRVWVLGASLGGPQAVRAFLSRLPGELPIAFILAQHIGEGFDRLLASQLDRETALHVACARAGVRLRHGDVLLAPLDQALRIDRDGCVALHPLAGRGIYSPSIDEVMREVAQRCGANAGAIVFSGMGDDGIEGARAIAAEGGVVWAQDAASAVISSMPDHARRAGVVSLSGSPESLADQLMKTLAAPDGGRKSQGVAT
jgi:chemotaxis response regulator CheB